MSLSHLRFFHPFSFTLFILVVPTQPFFRIASDILGLKVHHFSMHTLAPPPETGLCTLSPGIFLFFFGRHTPNPPIKGPPRLYSKEESFFLATSFVCSSVVCLELPLVLFSFGTCPRPPTPFPQGLVHQSVLASSACFLLLAFSLLISNFLRPSGPTFFTRINQLYTLVLYIPLFSPPLHCRSFQLQRCGPPKPFTPKTFFFFSYLFFNPGLFRAFPGVNSPHLHFFPSPTEGHPFCEPISRIPASFAPPVFFSFRDF